MCQASVGCEPPLCSHSIADASSGCSRCLILAEEPAASTREVGFFGPSVGIRWFWHEPCTGRGAAHRGCDHGRRSQGKGETLRSSRRFESISFDTLFPSRQISGDSSVGRCVESTAGATWIRSIPRNRTETEGGELARQAVSDRKFSPAVACGWNNKGCGLT